MGEKINRKGDENLYQPRIHSHWIRELHKVKEETGIPMTVLVNLAIKEYLAVYRTEAEQKPK